MYQILITTASGGQAVHTLAVSFGTEAQAIAAADLVNSGTTINQTGELFRHASLLFVPSAKSEGSGVGSDRGFTIPGVDKEAVNRVMDRFGQAVRSVEESRALDQVRTGFDRFVASAEQLMRRQSPGASPTGNAAAAAGAYTQADVAESAGNAEGNVGIRTIRFMRATEVTDTQQLAASHSPLAAHGNMILVWVNEADLQGQEEVFPAR